MSGPGGPSASKHFIFMILFSSKRMYNDEGFDYEDKGNKDKGNTGLQLAPSVCVGIIVVLKLSLP